MSKYHGMLADSIKDDIEALGPARRAEIELWANRLRSIVEAAGPDGWFALALVVADWNKQDAKSEGCVDG